MDRVADSLVIEDYDFDDDEEDEDLSDISEDEDSPVNVALKRKRELIDELVEKAEGDEHFSKVLSELSGYQPVITEQRKKSISLNLGAATNPQTNSTSSAAKKRSRPATSGSRFNRLSALTQAMRTGIISDDESGQPADKIVITTDVTDSEDLGFDGDEAELSQFKKIRTTSTSAVNQPASSLLNTPVKEEAALKVIPVPYDSEGNPVLPLSLNMITVHRLGEVVYDRPAYQNKRYILPVGFTTSRSYLSVISPDSSMTYFSTILDNGPAPLYQVTPEGHPEMVYQSTSTTGAWAAVAKAAAAIRGKDTAPSVSGPDYFGLANPTVSMLIEKLPNADKCELYVPKKYEVSNLVGGKTAKSSHSAATATAAVAPVHVEIDTDSSKQDQDNFDIHQNYI